MKKKNTITVIGITKNDGITGIQYGTIEITIDYEEKPKAPCPNNTTDKQNLSTHSKTVRHSIKQPALKWANKMSAAKKRILDAQRQNKK